VEIKDLVGVEQPLTKLVESVSNAIGTLYEPRRIRKKAKADAEAAVTLAEAEVQVEELKRRASERIAHTEARRQRNIDQIIEQAIKELPESVNEEPINEDWIAQFFNLSQDVGDSDMQILWARLLAGEVSCPGSYSFRTLQTVKVLSKEDARLFSQYCSYVWQISGGPISLYTDAETDRYIANKGVGLSERNHLKNLGLIYGTSVGMMKSSDPYAVISSRDNPFEVTYFGRRFLLTQHLNSNESAIVQPEILTDIGTQLFPISGAQPDESYLETLIRTLAGSKIEVTPLS
jgi:hypothetical protein